MNKVSIFQSFLITNFEITMDIIQMLISIFISIGVSLFTLTSAFLVSKTDSLDQIATEIKNEGHSISNTTKVRNARSFVNRMKRVTKFALFSIFSSFLALVLYIIFSYIYLPHWAYIILIPIVIGFIYIILCLKDLSIWYLRFHKNH